MDSDALHTFLTVHRRGGISSAAKALHRSQPAISRRARQSYTAKGKVAIEARVLFSPGRYEGKDMGAPLLFRFKREGGQWKIDDLRFQDADTLRKGLADDIKAASKKP